MYNVLSSIAYINYNFYFPLQTKLKLSNLHYLKLLVKFLVSFILLTHHQRKHLKQNVYDRLTSPGSLSFRHYSVISEDICWQYIVKNEVVFESLIQDVKYRV